MGKTVLITMGTNARDGTKIYHEPSESDELTPKCDASRTADTWVRKDKDLLPHHRMCKDCSGESKRGTTIPSTLSYKLQELDPDDIGGSA